MEGNESWMALGQWLRLHGAQCPACGPRESVLGLQLGKGEQEDGVVTHQTTSRDFSVALRSEMSLLPSTEDTGSE